MSYTSHMEIMMRRTVCFVFLTLLFQLIAVSSSIAADATSFDPTRVAVAAKGGGVPVGTIVAWPVAKNPEDMDNWLECNGQTVNATVYPELFALVGERVPDYRGLFLRGLGGNSAGLGQIQADAGRNAAGAFDAMSEYVFSGATGPFTRRWRANWSDGSDDRVGIYEYFFDLSRVWGAEHTANEFRPANQAVRYFIRAKM